MPLRFLLCRSRDLLVGAALAGGLVPELLGRLEWRSAREGPAPAERDEAVERVLVVDVLRLMAAEGPHAPEVGSVIHAAGSLLYCMITAMLSTANFANTSLLPIAVAPNLKWACETSRTY